VSDGPVRGIRLKSVSWCVSCPGAGLGGFALMAQIRGIVARSRKGGACQRAHADSPIVSVRSETRYAHSGKG
jgi:hypothetical protein